MFFELCVLNHLPSWEESDLNLESIHFSVMEFRCLYYLEVYILLISIWNICLKFTFFVVFALFFNQDYDGFVICAWEKSIFKILDHFKNY